VKHINNKQENIMRIELKKITKKVCLAVISSGMLMSSAFAATTTMTDAYDSSSLSAPITLTDRHCYQQPTGDANNITSVILPDGVRAKYGAPAGAVAAGWTIGTLAAHGKGELVLETSDYVGTITNFTKDGPGKLIIDIASSRGITFSNAPTFSNGAGYEDIYFRISSSGGTLTLPSTWGGDSTVDALAGSVLDLAGITSMPTLKGAVGSKLTLPASITRGTQKKIAGMKGRLVTSAAITLD
jgi:hypothetical protein